ncbi:hypothetical protein SAMN06272735_9118 [Streptomyces sp. TLI_55]|nr:hypothetical protein SAMN06272735_9118 [Streptomyces sp. TLI_55]
MKILSPRALGALERFTVEGVDSDPAITAQAQKLTPSALAVTFTVADAMAEFPADSMTAPTRPADMTFDDIVRETRNVLPGARLRRHLFWRYTLVWHHR